MVEDVREVEEERRVHGGGKKGEGGRRSSRGE